jgi:hypothetical protein
MDTTETRLSADERAHLIQQLRDSETEFLGLISGLTDAQWTSPQAPDGWSVRQVAEHLVLGEMGMLVKVKEALAGPPHPDWEELDARKARFLGRVLPDRSHKATAPERLQPHHNWTREETIARYQKGRSRTLQFVEELNEPVKDRTAEHPFPVFNTLNAYHWLLYIPLHNVRHNQQIAEIVKESIA